MPGNTVRIADTVPNRDGNDTLEGVDRGQFSDKSISLAPGQDISFVIDTTGSMGDDIDEVKASATDIIDAIFDEDNSILNSRVSVVGYNDPGTNTFLSFTDQPKIEDRKAAALAAINSISVGGGGDFPELVYSGLIRSLDGSAGEWREEAIARRIILFGDAPAKDTSLLSQVFTLAADVGVSTSGLLSIPSSIETRSLATGLDMVTFDLTITDEGLVRTRVPVEIFAVQIGSDSSTAKETEASKLS